jgi:ethanolamine utilization protein EutQ (cupin superfamily)
MIRADQYKIDFESMAWKTPAVGVRFKAYEKDGRKLRLIEFTKEFVEPGCTKGHIGYVLEGQLEIDIGGKVIVLGPGDGLSIPAGEEHKHKARILTDVARVVLVEDGARYE